MAVKIFDELFYYIDNVTAQHVAELVPKFIDIITPLMASCVVIYAIYLAYQALFDAQNMMVMESIKFMGALSLVCTVALSAPWYLKNIVPIVMKTGDAVAIELIGGTGSAGALQTMLDQILLVFDVMLDAIDFGLDPSTWGTAFMIIIQLVFLVIASVLFFLIAGGYLAVAKIFVSFLLILGPLFVMSSFFPSTRDFFKSWTGQCFNYILLTIMFTLAFTIFVGILDETVFSENISFTNTIITVIVFGIMVLVSVQIPVFTSSLSGGIGINGLVGSVAGTMGTIAKLLKGGGGGPKPPKPPKPPGGSNISAG